jgi:PAS domain S-box-containing protein
VTLDFALDFQKLVEGSGDSIMVCDAAGVIAYWNKACERIFGHTAEEAIGKSLDLIIPERQRNRHWEGYEKTMATGITKYGADLLRVPALHRDGRTLSIAFTVSLLQAADGKVTGIVAITRDETIRFADERALRKKVAELEVQVAATQASVVKTQV